MPTLFNEYHFKVYYYSNIFENNTNNRKPVQIAARLPRNPLNQQLAKRKWNAYGLV